MTEYKQEEMSFTDEEVKGFFKEQGRTIFTVVDADRLVYAETLQAVKEIIATFDFYRPHMVYCEVNSAHFDIYLGVEKSAERAATFRHCNHQRKRFRNCIAHSLRKKGYTLFIACDDEKNLKFVVLPSR